MQKLKDLIEKSQNNKEVSGISSHQISVSDNNTNNINNNKREIELNLNPAGISLEYGVLSDDDDSGMKTEYFGLELEEDDPELIDFVEPTESSLTSPEEWGTLHSDVLLDHPTSSYQWWDFWS